MGNRRRLCMAFLGLGCLSVFTYLTSAEDVPARGQPPQPPAPRPVVRGVLMKQEVAPAPGTEFSDAITLPKDQDAKRRIERAEDMIKDQDWGKAAPRLQSLLDLPEDVFVQVKRKDKGGAEAVQWTSVRAEANRLLGTLPPEGLQFYELQFGPRARARLNEAKQSNDPQVLAEVAHRYLHTAAGAEATNLLGTYHLDRGRYFMAALCFERLLDRPDADRLSPRTLFKAALAFERAGEKTPAEQTWKLLQGRARDGLSLGEQVVSLDQLHKELEKKTP